MVNKVCVEHHLTYVCLILWELMPVFHRNSLILGTYYLDKGTFHPDIGQIICLMYHKVRRTIRQNIIYSIYFSSIYSCVNNKHCNFSNLKIKNSAFCLKGVHVNRRVQFFYQLTHIFHTSHILCSKMDNNKNMKLT